MRVVGMPRYVRGRTYVLCGVGTYMIRHKSRTKPPQFKGFHRYETHSARKTYPV